MKNLLKIFCVFLFLFSCAKTEKNTSAGNSAPANSVSDEKSIKDDIDEQLQKLTIYEIIDLYINEKNGFFHVEAGDFDVSFVFLSHDKIQWAPGKSGFEFHPYFYIDGNNIHIEVFYYDLSAYQTLGERISAGKYYALITKENLISQYSGYMTIIENYSKKESFNINRFTHENLIFKILSDTIVYDSDSLQGERIARIGKEMKVQIIDVFFNNLDDKYPASVRINIEGTGSGWVDASQVDFLAKDIKETVNGMWLYNAVKNVIKEYGHRAVKGKIYNSIQLKSLPLIDSGSIILLWENAEVYIEDVSVNIDNDGIEDVWYKICLISGQVDDQFKDSNNRTITDIFSGWIPGSSIEINPVIDLSFNAGYR